MNARTAPVRPRHDRAPLESTHRQECRSDRPRFQKGGMNHGTDLRRSWTLAAPASTSSSSARTSVQHRGRCSQPPLSLPGVWNSVVGAGQQSTAPAAPAASPSSSASRHAIALAVPEALLMSTPDHPGRCAREDCGRWKIRHIGWRRDAGHLFKVFQCDRGHIFFVHWDHELTTHTYGR